MQKLKELTFTSEPPMIFSSKWGQRDERAPSPVPLIIILVVVIAILLSGVMMLFCRRDSSKKVESTTELKDVKKPDKTEPTVQEGDIEEVPEAPGSQRDLVDKKTEAVFK